MTSRSSCPNFFTFDKDDTVQNSLANPTKLRQIAMYRSKLIVLRKITECATCGVLFENNWKIQKTYVEKNF